MARLRSVLRPAAEWLLPKGAYDWVSDRARSALLAQDRRALPWLADNARLRDLHRGERCFILAAGPSVRRQDLTRLAGETVIAVSNTFVLPDYPRIAPRYHCVPDIFKGHGEFTTGFEDRFLTWLREMDRGTGHAVMLLSAHDKDILDAKRLFPGRRAHYIHFGESWSSLERVGLDLSRSLPPVQSVSVMALMAALYMGFEEVYLLGCDHDWLLHHGVSRHAYDVKDHVVLRTPGYSEWGKSDLEESLQSTLKLWQQYKVLKRIAERRRTRVFNATGGGLLDVFPPASFDELVGPGPQ